MEGWRAVPVFFFFAALPTDCCFLIISIRFYLLTIINFIKNYRTEVAVFDQFVLTKFVF